MESLSTALSPAQCGQSLTGGGSGENGRRGSGPSISLKKKLAIKGSRRKGVGNSWRMGKHWVERLVYCCLPRLGDLIAYLYVDEEKSSREGQSTTCRKEKEELLE